MPDRARWSPAGRFPSLRDLWARRRRHAASVVALVEALQHGGVGPLEQPLLAQGRGVAGVHEDPPFARAAVDAAVADRVVQAFVLEETWSRGAFEHSAAGSILIRRDRRTPPRLFMGRLKVRAIPPLSNDRCADESLRMWLFVRDFRSFFCCCWATAETEHLEASEANG